VLGFPVDTRIDDPQVRPEDGPTVTRLDTEHDDIPSKHRGSRVVELRAFVGLRTSHRLCADSDRPGGRYQCGVLVPDLVFGTL